MCYIYIYVLNSFVSLLNNNSYLIGTSIIYVGVSIVMGVPQDGSFLMNHSIKMDDLGVPPLHFRKPQQ